jgi:hypothetical protein
MKGTPSESLAVIVLFFVLIGCIQLPLEQPEKNVSECTDVYSPVCGVDNITYNNSCYARSAGVTVAYQGVCKDVTVTCSDTDKGSNILEAGEATQDSVVKSDVCVNATHINEYYCEGNRIANETKSCPSGYECSDSRCVEITIPPGCYDTDGGTDYSTAGTVYDEGMNYPDICVVSNLVKEYYCQNGKVSSTNIPCPQGYECSGGACVEQPSICSESDGGKDKYFKGTTTVSKGQDILTRVFDECVDEESVREYFCSDGAASSQVIDCDGDYECDDGACKILLCEDSDYGQDALTKGETEKGSVSKTDRCSGTYNVEEYYCQDNKIRSTIITCPSGRVCSNGRCIVEATCSETDGGNDIYEYGTTTKGSESKSDSCSGTYSVIEHYCSNNNIQTTTISCPPGYWCQDDECVPEPDCIDSDGGIDYDTKGTATKGQDTGTDSCDGDVLTEYYCSGNQIVPTTKTCDYGCQNGACSEAPLCYDSDGGKVYTVKGTISIGVESIPDACIDATTLLEYYCVGDTYDSETVHCAYPNSVCSNGACVGIVLS